MTSMVLFHSVYGLRRAELAAADRFRTAGHEVVTPDLFAGETAATVDDGFAIFNRITLAVVLERATAAVRELPDGTVLAGVSMGASVAGHLLADRPHAAGLLLLHGTSPIPDGVRAGLPAQLHVADPDEFEPADDVAAWAAGAERAGIAAQVFTYPGAGHYFTDPELPDHDGPAAELTWQRSLEFLGRL